MSRPKPDLDALRAQIAALEKRPALADDVVSELARAGREKAGADLELLVAPPGVLHEVFADEQRHSGVALGFALGLARMLVGGSRRGLVYLQLAGEAQELGLPYGVGLASFGIDPGSFVIGRVGTLPELLWAMEEAIACRAVAGVVADIAGHPSILDFTVSRRISLRAAAAGTSAFLLRYSMQREASAAKLRWRVAPAPSAGAEWDGLAPGPPRLAVVIEKRRLGNKNQRAEGTSMLLDWTENGFVPVDAPSRNNQPIRIASPPSGSVLATLGDRLPKAG